MNQSEQTQHPGALPRVSVVITNYNGAHALPVTIASLYAQQGVECAGIFLSDNRSSDDSVAVVQKQYPDVKIVHTESNNGPNPARNLGLRMADSDLVLIMDNDLVLAPDYMRRLADVLLQHPDAGAASGKIRYYSKPSEVQYNGVDIHFAGEVRLHDPNAQGLRKFSCVSAGAMMVRKSAVEVVGGFDEDYIFGWEDGDLAFRLSLSGFPCWVDSNANAYHQSQVRGMKWIKFQTRNRWWFVRQNYDRRTFYLCLPGILLFQIMAGFFMTLNGQAGAFFSGTWSGWGNSRLINEKYKKIQSLRKVSDRDLLCGDRFTLPPALGRSYLGRTIGWIIGRVFWVYWVVIRILIKRQ
jgi:GT2 family glycosyltransferase